jgi:hypothetical protein
MYLCALPPLPLLSNPFHSAPPRRVFSEGCTEWVADRQVPPPGGSGRVRQAWAFQFGYIICCIQAVKKFKAGYSWQQVQTVMPPGAGNVDDPRTRRAARNNAARL